MKVKNPAPNYIEVDPSQVTISGFEQTLQGLEAYGQVKLPNGHVFVTRIAYQDESGRWQAEGTIHREPPHDAIMHQIVEALAKRIPA